MKFVEKIILNNYTVGLPEFKKIRNNETLSFN